MNLKIIALTICVFINSLSPAAAAAQGGNLQDTVVAVIDSSINTSHEYIKNRCLKGKSFIIDESNETGHGTSVAGAVLKYSDIAANYFGSFKGNVEVLTIEINVLDIQEDYGRLMGEAIQYAVDSGADVINMSFSSASPNLYVYEKIMYGMEKGVIFVSAAGNGGYDSYSFPAAYEGVIAVGSCALNPEGGWERSEFSNPNDDVDLLLPGEKVLLPDGSSGFAEKTGTSFSAGALSGILGELVSRYPDLSPEHIAYALFDTAQPAGESRGSGYGIPDIKKAREYLDELSSSGISPLSRRNAGNPGEGEAVTVKTTAVSAGRSHIAYVSDGKVQIMGSRSLIREAALNWDGIVRIYAGNDSTVAIDSNLLPRAAGYNVFNKNKFIGWTDIKEMSLSSNFTAGLTSGGKVFVTDYLNGTEAGNWSGIRQISSGGYHLTAVKEDGSVLQAGYDIYGQMDTEDWKNIVYAASSSKNTVGIDKYGKAFAAGDNMYGQCGLDEWSGMVSADAGDGFVVGLKSDGTVAAKGRNIYGVCEVEDLRNIVYIDVSDTYFVAVDKGGGITVKGKMR